MDRDEAVTICDQVIGERGFAFSIDVDDAATLAVAAVGTDDPEAPELWLVDLDRSEGARVTELTDYPLGGVYWAADTEEGSLSVVMVSRYDSPPSDRQVIKIDASSRQVTDFGDTGPLDDYDLQKLELVRPRDGFVNVDW